MQVLYIAHNLDDPAIWRRVAMMRCGGAVVTVIGFRREDGPLPGAAQVLGYTRNARMMQRMASVLRARLGGLPDAGRFDVIMARNLEMLALAAPMARRAARGRGQSDGGKPRLVYEVLDIHRLMLRDDAAGRLLRRVERRLCRTVDLVLVSSPAFVTRYFDRFQQTSAPVLLIENKVLRTESPPRAKPPARAQAEGQPLVIGWFGILRCAFSLDCLDAVTRAAPGRYKVILRGRPAHDALPQFDATVARNPDLRFEGPYAYPDDLARIYGEVDLAWLVDRYDKGANSDWLLPNRLYESGLHGVPPICLAGTEAARKADRLNIGVRIADASAPAATDALGQIDAARLTALRTAMAQIEPSAWRADVRECRDLVAALGADLPAGQGTLTMLTAGGAVT